jgi:mannose-6-phosphate isomerase
MRNLDYICKMTNFVTKPIPAEKPTAQHVERPWGAFEQYASNQEVTVSLMTVKPGQRLSLQAHTGRAELWIALDDGAEVQLGDQTLRPRPGDELWIPANTPHRLSAADRPVRVLEIAFGNWQQADILRLADDYARPPAGE